MSQSQTAPSPSTEKRSPEEVMAELRRLRAQIRADNPDMTEADWEAFADRLAAEVNDGLRAHVRKSRGESE